VEWKVKEERKVAALIAAGYPADYEEKLCPAGRNNSYLES